MSFGNWRPERTASESMDEEQEAGPKVSQEETALIWTPLVKH